MEFINIIMAIILAGFGVFAFLHPEDAIYLESFWRYRDFEPSERYIRMTRIRGGCFVAVAILYFIFTIAS